MTYLAYDPERIGALAVAVRRADEELAGLSCDDPLAADALARVRLARLHLAQLWLPVLDRLRRRRSSRSAGGDTTRRPHPGAACASRRRCRDGG